MESVPYVSATFNGHTAQFLLDTGAGGVDVIFHGRAVEEFNLLGLIRSETYAELMGVNASGKGLEVRAQFVTISCPWIFLCFHKERNYSI